MGLFNNNQRKENVLHVIENRDLLKRYLMLISGLLIYAMAYNSFFVNNNLVFGGSSSIATILKDYINPSITVMFISIFSLLLSFVFMDEKFALNTVVGSLIFPFLITLTSTFSLPIPKDDMMLVAICGAVMIGFANGIIGRTGFSSGGIDSIVHILSKKLKISIGKTYLFVNGLIVLVGGYKFGWRILLYALIIL